MKCDHVRIALYAVILTPHLTSLFLDFPAEAIGMICERVEDPYSANVVARTTLKTPTIISLSKVCIRLARLIPSNRLLCKDMYFDHRENTHDMAKLCLDAV